MKILLSAATCSPYRGSESSLGWKVSVSLARSHEVHVMTFKGHETELTKARSEGRVPDNLFFHYVEPDWTAIPGPEKEKEFWWNSYSRYLKQVESAALKLHAVHQFDLVHHVAFATWRLPVPLHRLNLPFIWGPVGGAEKFPPSLLGILSAKGAMFEIVRYLGNLVSRLNPGLRAMVKAADAVVASNPDAYELLLKLRGHSHGMHSLLVSAFTPAEREALGSSEKPARRDPDTMYAFASGALEGRKGVSLALDAIALAKTRGLRIRYRVGSHGPEIDHLREQTKRLGLEQEVIFGAPLPREGYVQELLASDVYLLPSLRDNAPSTLMEAMLAGCVPVVAACGGPDVIVSDECGFRIPVRSRGELVEGIAQTLLNLQASPQTMRHLGMAARKRILEHYTIESYLQRIEEIYQDAIANHASKHKTQS